MHTFCILIGNDKLEEICSCFVRIQLFHVCLDFAVCVCVYVSIEQNYAKYGKFVKMYKKGRKVFVSRDRINLKYSSGKMSFFVSEETKILHKL